MKGEAVAHDGPGMGGAAVLGNGFLGQHAHLHLLLHVPQHRTVHLQALQAGCTPASDTLTLTSLTTALYCTLPGPAGRVHPSFRHTDTDKFDHSTVLYTSSPLQAGCTPASDTLSLTSLTTALFRTLPGPAGRGTPASDTLTLTSLAKTVCRQAPPALRSVILHYPLSYSLSSHCNVYLIPPDTAAGT